ncbi:MAG: hypothetical protein E5V16_22745, partial [Mesorhizobium sp.]
AKREAVAHLHAVMGVSERRACSFVGADRKMVVNGHRSFRKSGHPIFSIWRVKVSVISRRLDRSISVLLGGHAFSAVAAD